MKIVHVPFGFYPDPVGGTEVYVAALATGQQAQGVQVLVAAPGDHDDQYAYQGLPVRRFALGQSVGDIRELYGAGDPIGAAAFGRILDAERPDLVHLHALTHGASLLVAREARRRGIPVVFTYHTPTVSCQRGTLLHWGHEVCDGTLAVGRCTACALHGLGLNPVTSTAISLLPAAVGRGIGAVGLAGGPWTALRMTELVALRHQSLRALLAEADALVALCHWTRDLLVQCGVPANKITLSPHGLLRSSQHLAAAPPAPDAGQLRIAFLGRLDPTKGADLLIGGLLMLPMAPVRLDIYGIIQVGSEGYAEELRRMAAADPRITFLPPVANERVPNLLHGYDLLAVPSRWLETGPLVILEAFAAGVPVLGSRLGGIAELVTDGVDGLLVSPAGPADWRVALERLIGDQTLLARLRSGVRPPRRIEQVVDEMLALYASLYTKTKPAVEQDVAIVSQNR